MKFTKFDQLNDEISIVTLIIIRKDSMSNIISLLLWTSPKGKSLLVLLSPFETAKGMRII